MPRLETDRHWQRWGEHLPYFAVLVEADYMDLERGDASWRRFMASGEEYTSALMDRIARLGGPTSFDRALDFGCGVGRVLAPLAGLTRSAVGVDVSPAMRSEAEANLELLEIENASVVDSDDDLSSVEGRFDLVHSYNVFQHMAPARALVITSRLLDRLEPGGVVALHYCDSAPALHHRIKRIVGRTGFSMRLANRLRGKPADAPIMQMLPVSFDAVGGLLRDRGVHEAFVDWTRFGRNTFFQIHAVMPVEPDGG